VEGVLRELTDGGVYHVFEQWERRLQKCITVKGDYVEK